MAQKITTTQARNHVRAATIIIPELTESGSNQHIITSLEASVATQEQDFELMIETAYNLISQKIGYPVFDTLKSFDKNICESFYLQEGDCIEIPAFATAIQSVKIISKRQKTELQTLTTSFDLKRTEAGNRSFAEAIVDVDVSFNEPVRLVIEYKVGWTETEVPAAINSSALIIIARLHDNRADTTPLSVNMLPIGIDSLLFEYRRI